ncbi:ATP-dependent 6-phosphofructokinase [Candidatus Nucleicultrix amoebiphila]|jgi:6-phosphofructokinase 1|uniref:ATP-dependent 6-phosphofructokinase n=1 Tax=Candidatus Nucleicultrix amoebiphila FS5 TaxID=1414854 RepID=A0A1W6N4U7_9PROT|nr:ATP-dependent 6-phosphofructokinase [Candidatus Nucleicultrix amoebiphila]ARN84799.1 6-phosphofructokinase [Candidatus Nucleicultrix amoebiphila FS5]
MKKRIGILTSGGDCAGLNMVLAAVTSRAIHGYGWDVYGIRQGTLGLLRRPVEAEPLTLESFRAPIPRMGGTILGTTNKGDPFAFPLDDGHIKDRSEEFAEGCKILGLDGLIGIGGDGSLNILRRLAHKGHVPFIGIPKTIDNDIGLTENSIGFTTAVDVATEALDRLQPTAASHDRVMILEVMGRDAGHIALSAGIAGGAHIILIPEIPYTLHNVAKHIQTIMKEGHNFALVIVAEAVKTEDGEKVVIADPTGRKRFGGISHYLADRITELTGAETRFTVLGHVQRGGQPNASDRLLASSFGVHAVDLIAQGKSDRMVAWQNRCVVDVSLEEAIKSYGEVEPQGTLVKTARGLGICLGDS